MTQQALYNLTKLSLQLATVCNEQSQPAMDLSPWKKKMTGGPEQVRKKLKWLQAFSRIGAVNQTIRATGISCSSHYNWQRTDPAYAEAFEQAELVAADFWEAEGIRRGVEGIARLKFYKGEPIMVPAFNDKGEPITEQVEVEVKKMRYKKVKGKRKRVTVTETEIQERPVLVPYVELEYSDKIWAELMRSRRPDRYKAFQINQTISDQRQQNLQVLLSQRKAQGAGGENEQYDYSIPPVEMETIGEAFTALEQAGIIDLLKTDPKRLEQPGVEPSGEIVEQSSSDSGPPPATHEGNGDAPGQD